MFLSFDTLQSTNVSHLLLPPFTLHTLSPTRIHTPLILRQPTRRTLRLQPRPSCHGWFSQSLT